MLDLDRLNAERTIQLVGAAALPIVEALDEPCEPRVLATRVRVAVEGLIAVPGLAPELAGAARAVHLATADVLEGRRGGYRELLRATRRLLAAVDLPVPFELSDEGPVERD